MLSRQGRAHVILGVDAAWTNCARYIGKGFEATDIKNDALISAPNSG